MINKLAIKLTFWLIISSTLLPSAAQGVDILADGRPIASTPFDPKVLSVGLFSGEKFSGNLPQKQSVEDLFAIARSFRYVHVSKNRWQTPRETQERGSGDCADKSVWLYAQLKQNGYENVRLVIGKYRRIDTIFHVWVVYTDDQGKSYLLDPAIQKRTWETGRFEEGFYKALYSYNGQNRYRYDF